MALVAKVGKLTGPSMGAHVTVHFSLNLITVVEGSSIYCKAVAFGLWRWRYQK